MRLERLLLLSFLGRLGRFAPLGCGGQTEPTAAASQAHGSPEVHAGENGMMALIRASALALTATLLLAVGQASALTAYPDYVGTSVTYTNLQEASSSGDPEPLWGAPTGVGNQLLFFPAAFRAEATPLNGGFDHTGSQFQALVTGNSPTDVITQLNITEYGDAQIGGPGGTSATGTYAAMSGFITVLADISGPIAPIVIPFSGAFTPSDTLDYVNNLGTTLWSATVQVDLSSLNATQVQISLDNDLYAFSEATTTAAIQKKVVSGPAVIIEAVPEPTTGLLVGGGLVILSLRGRRRRVA